MGAAAIETDLLSAERRLLAGLSRCLGMIDLKDNPPLREPLALDHRKARLRGGWVSEPGAERRPRPFEPSDPDARPRRDPPIRPRPSLSPQVPRHARRPVPVDGSGAAEGPPPVEEEGTRGADDRSRQADAEHAAVYPGEHLG